MRKIILNKISLSLVAFFLSFQLVANVQLTESFTNPNFPTSSFHNGTYTLSSGTWDAKNVMGLETINAYNQTGEAVKLNRYLESYLTTPSVSSVGSISFYYRNFTDLLGGGSFTLQKSVNNGPFVDITTVNFSATDSYELLTVDINDASSDIKFRIYIPEETNTGYLCIDEIIITDIGQTLTATPSELNDVHYFFGFGPSESKSFTLLGSNLTGYPDNITLTAPANYEISINNSTFSGSLSIPYSSSTLTPTTVYVRLIEGLTIGDYNLADISISGGGAPAFNVTCNGSVTEKPLPIISTTPSSLSGYSYVFGAGPTAPQSFSLSVTNLNDYPDVVSVIAPEGFQVSIDYVTYFDNITIDYSSAIMTTTPVYVRLKSGLAVNSYSGNIVINAEDVISNVFCSGSVTAPSIPTLTTSEEVMAGYTYVSGLGPSESQSFELNGANLTGFPDNISITAPTNYEISIDNITFSEDLYIPYTNPTLETTTIYIRLISGLPVGSYNNEIISINGGGATAHTVSCYGTVTNPPTPIISVNLTDLSEFEYYEGSGPSIPQSFNISGVNLTDIPSNITVTAPTNYEVSYDYPNFYPIVNIPYNSATLDWTPVYVRLKSGLAVGTYNSEDILISAIGAENVSLTCNGEVKVPLTPYLSISPSSLSGFNYIVGSGPSTPQSYNLSGTNLTGFPSNISVTAPTNYEISLNSGSGYAASLNIPYSSATLGSTPIYVRLKAGLSVGTYNSEIIANAGGGATTVNVTCNGSVEDVPPPSLVANPTTLNGFTYIEGNGPSSYQSYSISGTYLTGFPGSITISAPTNYEISLSSGSGYSTSLNVAYSTATLASTTIYVRLKSGLSIETYNSETITNAGGGASTVNITCNGNVTDVPPPTLQVSQSSLSGLTYTEGNGPSTTQSYSLSGTYLTGFPANITVNAPTNYEISLSSDSGFTNTLTIPYETATLSSTSIYVRLKSGLSVGTYNSEFITNSGGGAVDIDVACNGSVSAVSTDPCLEEDFSGFTAGTHASPNSTDISSSLDTYTQTTGWTGLKVYQAGGEIKLGSSSAVGYIITPTIDLSAGGTLEFDYAKWTSDNSMVQIFHASDGVNFVQVGSDISTTDDFQAHSVEITGGTALSKIKIGGTDRIYLDNIVIYCGGSAPTPELTANPTSLTGFYYTVGSGPSIEQSFVVSGTDLDGTNVIVTPPANYEISEIPIGGFQSSPIVLSSFNGADRSIFVRLKEDLDVGTYNSDIITISGGGADDVTVSLNGEVLEEIVPELIANPTSLTGFYYTVGSGPSIEQSFVVSGTDLDGTNVIVTPPANYEISEIPIGGFQSSPIVLSSFNGADRSIFVRLKEDLDVGTYNSDIITISGGGADDVTVSLNGEVLEEIVPELIANPTELNGFNYIEGFGPSAEQSFILSGTDLNDDQLSVSPPTNYEISLSSGTNFQNTPIIFNSFDGNATTFYVRLKSDLAVGDYNNEQIVISGSGAAEIVVTCNGFVDPFVGLCQDFTNDDIQIYPNPATDFINIGISKPFSGNIKIEIYDITGKIVYESAMEAKSENSFKQINISEFNPGVYLLRLSDKNKTVIRKIDVK